MTTLELFRSQEMNFDHLLFLFPAAVLCICEGRKLQRSCVESLIFEG